MKLKSIAIEGFGSFAERTEIWFDDQVTFVLGENRDAGDKASSNAAGKSSIIDAIVWALYGRTATGRDKDGVICHFRDSVEVELDLEDLVIRRSKKRTTPESLTYRETKSDWVVGDFPIVSSKLMEVIRLPFDTFCNTVYLGRTSKTIRFLEATSSERLEVFSSLLDVERFTRAVRFVSEDINSANEEVSHANAYINALRDIELTLRRESQELQGQIVDIRERTAEGKVATHKAIKKLEEEQVSIQRALLVPPSGDMDALQAEKITLKRQIESEQMLLAEYQAKLGNAKRLEEGDLCPSCLRELGEDEAINLENNLDSLKELVKAKKKEIVLLGQRVLAISEKQDAIRTFRDKQKESEHRLREIAAEIRDLQDSLLTPDLDRLQALLAEKVKQLKNNQEQIRNKQAELAKVVPNLEVLKTIKKSFQSEVRNMLLDKVRIGLERYSNIYLDLLAGKDYKIAYPNTSKTGRETFEIMLHYGGFCQKISAFSGGETWKASFAILLALRAVLEERNNSPFDFLFVDDPLGPLDDVGAQGFVNLLSQLSTEKKLPQILVTVPRKVQTLKDVRTLTVVKERKVSRISL